MNTGWAGHLILQVYNLPKVYNYMLKYLTKKYFIKEIITLTGEDQQQIKILCNSSLFAFCINIIQ